MGIKRCQYRVGCRDGRLVIQASTKDINKPRGGRAKGDLTCRY